MLKIFTAPKPFFERTAIIDNNINSVGRYTKNLKYSFTSSQI